QTKPVAPITTNEARQPNPLVNSVTTTGVTTAPRAAPELKIPLPRLRSEGGRIRAVTRSAQGQLNDSPTPRRIRQAMRTPRVGPPRLRPASSATQAPAPPSDQRRSHRSTR